MFMQFDNIVSLPSGNTARNFKAQDCGYGRIRISYDYTDRRRNHQVSRHFEAEFLNGRLEQIIARSACNGRVETFHGSTVMDVLEEIVKEVSRINAALSNFRKDSREIINAPVEAPEQEDTDDLLDTLKVVGGMVMVNILITLATLGIIGYNL